MTKVSLGMHAEGTDGVMDFVCNLFLSMTGASSLFVASTSLAFALKVPWRAAQLRIQPSLIAGLFFRHEMGGLPPPMAEVIILNLARPGNVLGAILGIPAGAVSLNLFPTSSWLKW